MLNIYSEDVNKLEVKLDKFESLMVKFLDENYEIESTLSAKWSLYSRLIHPIEEMNNKYLYDFNDENFIDMFKSVITVNESTLINLYSYVSIFLVWAKENKFILSSSPFFNLNKDMLLEVNNTISKSLFFTIDDMWELCKVAETKGVIKQDCLPVMLSAYGVVGKDLKHLRNLTIDDIDRERLEINIVEDEELVNIIKIDQRMLDFILEAREEDLVTKKGKVIVQEDDRYIIKRYRGLDISGAALYKKADIFFTANDMNRVPFTTLQRNKKIIDILEIRERRQLRFSDFKQIQKRYNPESGDASWFKFKRDYTNITNDNDVKRDEKVVELLSR